jgi:hypothetical protein
MADTESETGVQITGLPDGEITGLRAYYGTEWVQRALDPTVRVEKGRTYVVDWAKGTLTEKGAGTGPAVPLAGVFATPQSDPRDAERHMQRILREAIIAAVAREEVWIAAQLELLAVGESLCVHARHTEIDADGERGWTNTWTTSAHVLPRGYECSDLGQHRVFGPMPECLRPGCELRYGHPGECNNPPV